MSDDQNQQPTENINPPNWINHIGNQFASVLGWRDKVELEHMRKMYVSNLFQLNPLGTYTLNTRSETLSVVIQKQGGYLDGTTVSYGDFVYTYPSLSTQYDIIALPSPGLPIKVTGNSGDSYLLQESVIPNLRLSWSAQTYIPAAQVSLTGSNTNDINQVSITNSDTAQQLPSFACNKITIVALPTNAAVLYVGKSNVSDTTGVPFNKGDSQDFNFTNLDQLYIYGTAGDGVAYVVS